ncbi:MAG: hypothetical protein JWP32_1084, partial [Schumannella sp.]|nr:hypothetical protein [Schumannella sp.]
MRAPRLRLHGLTRRRVIGVAATTAVLLAAGVGAVFASTGSASDGYRTAVAALGSVAETVAVNGTIASATRSD